MLPIPADVVDYVIALLLGASVGFIEILSRYRDEPFRVARSAPSFFYIFINALAAVAGLWAIRMFDWAFTSSEDPNVVRWVQVIAAGFGAMIIFRSSLFVFRVGSQDVSVGPNTVLQILLDAVDREVDRHRGKARAKAVSEAMREVSFKDAIIMLPTICIALLQNLPEKDQDVILERVDVLQKTEDMPLEAKKMALGLTIINAVGEDVLRASIEALDLRKPKRDGRFRSVPGSIDVLKTLFSREEENIAESKESEHVGTQIEVAPETLLEAFQQITDEEEKGDASAPAEEEPEVEVVSVQEEELMDLLSSLAEEPEEEE